MKLPMTGIGASEGHAIMILDSYKKWVGRDFLQLTGGRSAAEQLFYAPLIVLSHGTEEPPILNYGNEGALSLWRMDWDRFTAMPSSHTAEQVERTEREHFLQAVNDRGYVDNYSGIRISSRGRRFHILDATVWNLTDDQDRNVGQAAAFREYRFI